ncbi:MAG: helix-turn-helix transcriptional regulator [Peptostreptococcaceae bacterium]|nr:helix-turn-helix transcriptional regulator [Peptostreptococcaceae bacterium]
MQKNKRKGVGQITPFGILVKKALIEKNMTQKQLAEEIGVDSKYLHLVFYGYRSGTKYLHRIAKYLKLKEVS